MSTLKWFELKISYVCPKTKKNVLNFSLRSNALEDNGCGYDGDFSTYPVIVVEKCPACGEEHQFDGMEGE